MTHPAEDNPPRSSQAQHWWRAPALRWTIVFVVAVIALVVAIWPRGTNAPTPDPAAAGPSASRATDAPVAADELAKARAQAGVESCPQTGLPMPTGAALAGVVAPCLADGSEYDLGRGTAGKPMLVNMWAVWCLPCRRELPVLAEYAKRAGDQITVLTVHSVDGASNPYLVLKFLAEVGVTLPTVLDTQSKVAAALSAPKVFPSTILVRADGTVAKVLPQVFADADEVASAVRTNLGVQT